MKQCESNPEPVREQPCVSNPEIINRFLGLAAFICGFISGYTYAHHKLSNQINHTLDTMDKLTRELQEQHP